MHELAHVYKGRHGKNKCQARCPFQHHLQTVLSHFTNSVFESCQLIFEPSALSTFALSPQIHHWLDSVDWSGYGTARYWPSFEVVWTLNPYKVSCQRGDVMPVACWVSCGEGQALEGRLDGGTVWPEKQPSAGERCVFSHTLSPLANTVREGFSRTG